MRLLFVHDHAPEATATERRLTGRSQLKVFHSLGEAIRDLSVTSWRPEVVILDLRANPAHDLALLMPLRELVGPIPLFVGSDAALAYLDTRAPPLQPSVQTGYRAITDQRQDLAAVVDSLVDQQRALSQTILAYRTTSAADIERIAKEAAEIAVTRAIDQLTQRLGLEDAEGIRLAIRCARAWEEAKGRFLSALTTGVASAFLLAIGAGIVAFVRNGGNR